MGREVRRVPLDFEWPIGEVWKGFINPHYRRCPYCKAGYSAAYEAISEHINRLMWDQRVQEHEAGRKITTFLAGRSSEGRIFGHDSMDAWAAIRKIGELAGLDDSWRCCSQCDGTGVDPLVKAAYEAWEDYDPPAGDGWQVWETVSEGSPVSPVFPTAEELATWITQDRGCTYETAMGFVSAGWAPSMFGFNGHIVDGVIGVGTIQARKEE